MLASELDRCQCQLACARVDDDFSRGSLQWMLKKGVVCVVGGCSIKFGELEPQNPVRVARWTEEVDTAPTSLAVTEFAGQFHLGKPDYHSFHQFCRGLGSGCSSSDSED
ncbi:unnamed protein product [Lactuca saligna]|uniref:Uncharacterized protein n=1 Tax=Lactuca saligna TaxID=75948 RepID=A0AA36A4N0_LACSI|nr:unnamed protein product [Lactuca saligna]